ncbi:Oxygenase domain of the 2OGFeDO superfamily protein [Haloechinothrix alba]|uniref:Oxygenase domain of the 2OGFeDO superfamily protein n=1 Tax=Haloechinothrix alba TaxID=664784 RepID=A0A238WCH3_9PSEU|nr:hypothetical protein [Haloechinothrix alba]SNR44275.1 Oxygenase domain of the 2OGFeDO superfamily protein [Haloechinothrix alba]
MIDLRLRSRISDGELDQKIGKVITPRDWNLVLTGPATIRKPNGHPLCVYLPKALDGIVTRDMYEVLHGLRGERTENRGIASGSPRVRRGNQKATYSRRVPSAIIGAFDAAGREKYCRLTAWTGRNLPQWQTLHPLLRAIAGNLEQHVPDRYAAQLAEAQRTHQEWVVPDTPFTTVTVNNTYPTGVHTDAGDLDAGFSTLACLRRGTYTGGHLCFPRYRVAVDMHDTDLILMDAHEYHGNAHVTCTCGTQLNGMCDTCGAERISVVSYFRTKMTACGTEEEEQQRAVQRRENRNATR